MSPRVIVTWPLSTSPSHPRLCFQTQDFRSYPEALPSSREETKCKPETKLFSPPVLASVWLMLERKRVLENLGRAWLCWLTRISSCLIWFRISDHTSGILWANIQLMYSLHIAFHIWENPLKSYSKVGVLAQVCKPRTWDAEAGGLDICSQLGISSKIL